MSEVHNITQEGLRAFPRPFRGVNEVYLYRGVAIFEWEHDIERVKPEFTRAMPGAHLHLYPP